MKLPPREPIPAPSLHLADADGVSGRVTNGAVAGGPGLRGRLLHHLAVARLPLGWVWLSRAVLSAAAWSAGRMGRLPEREVELRAPGVALCARRRRVVSLRMPSP